MLWYHSYLIWLVFEGSIPVFACFPERNLFCDFKYSNSNAIALLDLHHIVSQAGKVKGKESAHVPYIWYKLSATSSICFGAKFASWLSVMMHLLYLIRVKTCQHAHIIMPQFYQWTCPDPVFQRGCSVCVQKIGVLTTTALTQSPSSGFMLFCLL